MKLRSHNSKGIILIMTVYVLYSALGILGVSYDSRFNKYVLIAASVLASHRLVLCYADVANLFL